MKLSKNFSSEEFECRCGCMKSSISPSLVLVLQRLRDLYGESIQITSGVRCEEWNKKIGGSKTSSHIKGLAVDIAVSGSRQRFELTSLAIEAGFNRVGIAKDFIHLDIDQEKAEFVLWTY